MRARITGIMGTMLCLAHYMLCSLAFGRSEHLILKFSNGISRLLFCWTKITVRHYDVIYKRSKQNTLG